MSTLDDIRLANATGLYLEGIRDGNSRSALEKYTGARYRQHSTGVPDGREGFTSFFDEFLERTPQRDIEVVRGWVDGQYVFLHVFQSLNGGEAQWVTADIFDTDSEGKLIEHWDVISAFAAKTPSGHTNIDGPTQVVDLEHTGPNKALVHRAIETLLMRGGDPSRAAEFIDASQYTQHSPELADGLEPFAARLEDPTRSLWYERTVLTVGRGNFVATLSETSSDEQRHAQVDVFRVEGGKIVEHWDAIEPCPPPEELVNSGKF